GAAAARTDSRSRPERSASTPERGTLRGPLAAWHRQCAAHLGWLGARLAVVETDAQGIRGVTAKPATPRDHSRPPTPPSVLRTEAGQANDTPSVLRTEAGQALD